MNFKIDLKSIDLKNISLDDIQAKLKNVEKKTWIKLGTVVGAVVFFLIIFYGVLNPIVNKKKAQLDDMNLKIKETDRLVALKNEISKFKTDVIIDDQSIEIKNFPKVLPENIEIDTYHDHRMALAFSPLSILVKLVINDYGVISKSFPEYWTILQKLNFDLEFDN